MPDGVLGPTGDKPVLAEILWLVTRERPWLVAAAFLGVVLLVLADGRSVVETLWVLLPLVCGLAFCLGCWLSGVAVMPGVLRMLGSRRSGAPATAARPADSR